MFCVVRVPLLDQGRDARILSERLARDGNCDQEGDFHNAVDSSTTREDYSEVIVKIISGWAGGKGTAGALTLDRTLTLTLSRADTA